MTEKRIKVEPVIDDNSIGAWSVRPNKCPAAAALKLLGQKPWTCASGLFTNAQGAVPIHQCKHKRGDMEESGGEAFVVCGFSSDDEEARDHD